MTLFRAADDGYSSQGTSFAAEAGTARLYLDNPGYGGRRLWAFTVTIDETRVLDLTDTTVEDAAQRLGVPDPGAIGVEEWLPSSPRALDAARAAGYLWARVRESYPADTITWVYLGSMDHGDEDPEGVEVEAD